MFSPTFSTQANIRSKFGFNESDAFRKEGRQSLDQDLDKPMNPPPKRGKYSMTADLNEMMDIGSGKLKDGWKQCEYVSNRTRLRCKNIRKAEMIKDYGFCEEHIGYIERLRKEGLRTKHFFDPGFNISQSFMDLISCDDDEALEPHYSAEFPFVYESMYCDRRLDNETNPLRRAGIYTKKEILAEYIRSMDKWNESIRQQRTIYKEKYIRVLQQIARLKHLNLAQLDPIKDAEKVKKLKHMRKEALRLDNYAVLRKKFRKVEDNTIKTSSELCEKWAKQIEEPIDDDKRVAEIVVNQIADFVAVAETRGKRGRPSHEKSLNVANMITISRRNFLSLGRIPPLPKALVTVLKELHQHSQEKQHESEQEQLSTNIAHLSQQASFIDGPSSSAAIQPKQTAYGPQFIDGFTPHQNHQIMKTKRRETITAGYNAYRPLTTATIIDPHGYFPVPGDNLGNFVQPSTSNAILANSSTAAIALNNVNGGIANSIIRPICIGEDINPEMFMKISSPLFEEINGLDSTRKRKSSGESTMVCARINCPWDGTNTKRPPSHLAQQHPTSMNNNIDNHYKTQTSPQPQVRPHQEKHPSSGNTPKISSPSMGSRMSSSNGSSNSSTGTSAATTYQQYLQQRHIQVPKVQTPVLRHQMSLSQNQRYANKQQMVGYNIQVLKNSQQQQGAQRGGSVASGRGRGGKRGGTVARNLRHP